MTFSEYGDMPIATFCLSNSRVKHIVAMAICVCLSLATFLHNCADLDVILGNGRGYPLVVHYWADLQLVYGFRCHVVKCQRGTYMHNFYIFTKCILTRRQPVTEYKWFSVTRHYSKQWTIAIRDLSRAAFNEHSVSRPAAKIADCVVDWFT